VNGRCGALYRMNGGPLPLSSFEVWSKYHYSIAEIVWSYKEKLLL